MHKGALEKFKETIDRAIDLVETRSLVDVDWYKDSFTIRGPLAYVLNGTCADEYRALVLGLLKQPIWRERVSEKYIREAVSKIIVDAVAEGQKADAGVNLELFIKKTEDFDTEQRVFLPVQLLQVKIPEIKIGRVRFRAATDDLIAQILEGTHVTREYFFSGTPIWTIAEYRVVAEKEKAIELAEDEVRAALDILSYALSFQFHLGAFAPVDLQGDVPSGDRTMVVRPSSGGCFVSSGTNPSEIAILTEEVFSSLVKSGLNELSDLLKSESRSDFEDWLLLSVHWFASAQKQRERSNRILALATALETMLTNDTGPISNGVAEGVAFVLGSDLPARKAVKNHVLKLYKLRSKISHGAQSTVLLEDLQRLTALTRDFLYKLILAHKEFKTKSDLLEWIETQRLS